MQAAINRTNAKKRVFGSDIPMREYYWIFVPIPEGSSGMVKNVRHQKRTAGTPICRFEVKT